MRINLACGKQTNNGTIHLLIDYLGTFSMRLLHPAAADHSVSINRQQVQRIFRFSLRSRAGARPLSGGTGAVATGGPTNWDPYQKATDTAPSSVPWRPPVPLFSGAG